MKIWKIAFVATIVLMAGCRNTTAPAEEEKEQPVPKEPLAILLDSLVGVTPEEIGTTKYFSSASLSFEQYVNEYEGKQLPYLENHALELESVDDHYGDRYAVLSECTEIGGKEALISVMVPIKDINGLKVGKKYFVKGNCSPGRKGASSSARETILILLVEGELIPE